MIRPRDLTLWLVLAACCGALAPAVPAHAATPAPLPLDGDDDADGDGAKGDEAPPAPDEDEAKDYIKEFAKTVKKMTEEDAIAGVRQLSTWYQNPGVDDKVKKEIIKALQKSVKQKGREALQEATAKELAKFGEDGAGLLKYMVSLALNEKVLPLGVVKEGLKALGEIASPSPGDIKFLSDLLKHREDDVIMYALRALSGYAKSLGAIRRDLFEEVMKISEGVYSKSEANDPTGKRRWNIWGSDAIETMQKLTRRTFNTPPEFRQWLNDKDEGGGKNPRTWVDVEPGK